MVNKGTLVSVSKDKYLYTGRIVKTEENIKPFFITCLLPNDVNYKYQTIHVKIQIHHRDTCLERRVDCTIEN